MSLIELLPNNFIVFFYFPVLGAEAKRTFSPQKEVKNYQRLKMVQN